MKSITSVSIDRFGRYLCEEEKAAATIEKYLRDVRAFAAWLGERSLSKQTVLEYKAMLVTTYAPASVNSMLSSLNCFFAYCGRHDCRVKALKIQRQILPREIRS